MKKITCFLAVVLAACVCLASCGKNNTDITPDDSAGETKIDYAAKYEDVIADVYEFIKNVNNEDESADGFVGIWEAALALENEALNQIGYTIKDISGDQVPELLIGAFNKEEWAYTNNEIYAIYALKNDKPEVIIEGMSRSAYSLNDDCSLFYQGSSGAAYSMFGTYRVSENNDVVCEDYYFTYPDDNDPAKIDIYHNNSGDFSKDNSEKLDITLDDFWSLQEEAASKTAKLEAIPFAELDEVVY